MFNIEKEVLRGGFEKYHLRGFPFYGVIHRITETDSEESIHDHPFPFTSLVLKGSYIEKRYIITGNNTYSEMIIERKEGSYHQVAASTVHQIIELPEGECWTFIVPGKHVDREWGFYKFGDEILHRFHNEPEFSPLKDKRI